MPMNTAKNTTLPWLRRIGSFLMKQYFLWLTRRKSSQGQNFQAELPTASHAVKKDRYKQCPVDTSPRIFRFSQIIDQILYHLPTNALIQCLAVNRIFQTQAQILLVKYGRMERTICSRLTSCEYKWLCVLYTYETCLFGDMRELVSTYTGRPVQQIFIASMRQNYGVLIQSAEDLYCHAHIPGQMRVWSKDDELLKDIRQGPLEAIIATDDRGNLFAFDLEACHNGLLMKRTKKRIALLEQEAKPATKIRSPMTCIVINDLL